MNKLFSYAFFLYVLIPLSAYTAQPWQGSNEGMLLYSSMGYIKEEGEYSGLQIAILPYNPYYKPLKYKVLWRSGAGYLEPPLLLDARVHDDEIKIAIPKGYDAQGEWTLTLAKNALLAEGPLNQRYELKRIKLK